MTLTPCCQYGFSHRRDYEGLYLPAYKAVKSVQVNGSFDGICCEKPANVTGKLTETRAASMPEIFGGSVSASLQADSDYRTHWCFL
jgi:hypothetical protein